MGENTDVYGTAHPVSLRRAARRAGLSVEEFQAAVDPLNGTPEDLRIPGSRPPGRYDPERLARWIQAFRLPDQPLREYSVEAAVLVIAHWTGAGWVLTAPATGLEARGPRLVTARRKLAHLLAPVVGKQPAEVEFTLTWDLDPAALQMWTESLEFKDLARQLLTLAAHKRDTALAMLTDSGMTGPEIGAALGVSHQRVQQLLARGRNQKASAEETSG